jgi:hypothetical protein
MLLPEVLLFEISPSCAIVANTLVAEPLARTLQRWALESFEAPAEAGGERIDTVQGRFERLSSLSLEG